VKINTTLAKHDEFEFGASKWDLILCSYCGIAVADPHWPEVLLKALRPGGMVVYQGFSTTPPKLTTLMENWKRFHILRIEDEDPGYIDDDWNPSRTNRTILLVARKE
jgi:hypothetical protein